MVGGREPGSNDPWPPLASRRPSAHFTIMPRFKIRAVGDSVANEDQVLLVAVKKPVTLHVSPNAIASESARLEVTGSQVPSRFRRCLWRHGVVARMTSVMMWWSWRRDAVPTVWGAVVVRSRCWCAYYMCR